MEQNIKKMEDFGINTLAYEMMCSMKDKKKHRASKMVSEEVFSKDIDYRPNEEGELDESNEDTNNEVMENRRILRSCTKKVMYIH